MTKKELQSKIARRKEIQTEIARVKQAIEKSDSVYLKRDMSKYLKRLERELRDETKK